jgi:hypothetical protein
VAQLIAGDARVSFRVTQACFAGCFTRFDVAAPPGRGANVCSTCGSSGFYTAPLNVALTLPTLYLDGSQASKI